MTQPTHSERKSHPRSRELAAFATSTGSGCRLFRSPTYGKFALRVSGALQWGMPTLTRRRYPKRSRLLARPLR